MKFIRHTGTTQYVYMCTWRQTNRLADRYNNKQA